MLPAETLLDTYNADGDAQVPVWWSAAVDVTAASWYDGGNPWYPYSPIDDGEVSPQYVALQNSPGHPGTAVPVVSTATDTFTFGDESQLTTLTDHALLPRKAGSINGALSSVGFYGTGDWLYMSYTYLVTDVQRIGFETVCESEYNCPEPYGAGSCFDDSAQLPTIPVGSGSIYQCYPGQDPAGCPTPACSGRMERRTSPEQECGHYQVPPGAAPVEPGPAPDPRRRVAVVPTTPEPSGRQRRQLLRTAARHHPGDVFVEQRHLPGVAGSDDPGPGCQLSLPDRGAPGQA